MVIIIRLVGEHCIAAIAEVEKARQLDPRSVTVRFRESSIMERRDDPDGALKVAQELLKTDKDHHYAKRASGSISLLRGDYAKVIELGNERFSHPKKTHHVWASFLATAFHKTGQTDKAAAMLNRLKGLAETDSKALYFLVTNYSELGRADEAISALQKCLKLREELMIWTKDEPRLANLRGDARFQEILRRMNLAK